MSRIAQHTQGEEDLYGERLGAGALVGSYLVDALIGEGGFAAIYRARHLVTGAPAAVKVLRGDFAVSTRMLRRFRQEARAVQRIRNPHIVDILETGTLHDHRPFLVMEWLDGQNLAQVLAARGAMPLPLVLALAEQIGSALAAAHAAGVVHRDLKAQNVMLLGQHDAPAIKVVDFGIAKLLEPPEGEAPLTTISIIGTPATMAPEQILRQPVDPRTDIYAFGVLLFLLVTGRLPFEGASAIEIEDKHLHAPPPRASERAPVPPRLDEVIARCMEKQKEARYAGVAALLEELRQVASAAPAPAPRCLGVYVTALIEGDADDDAVLDALDAVLDQARACLEAVGLSVAVETGNALLAVAALDEVDPDQVLDAVHGLAGDRVAVSVHVAPAERRAGRYVGGELFRLGAWEDTATGRAPAAGTVTITGAARSVLQTAEPRPVTC